MPRSELVSFISRAGVICLGLLGASFAQAWNDEVTEACTHEGRPATVAETAICHAYIEGFLDGAIVTDAAIVQTVSEKDNAESDYIKRAYLTRVGSNRRLLPATALAHFCLPEGTERAKVVGSIADAVARSSLAGEDVAASVYDTLKASYPCAK